MKTIIDKQTFYSESGSDNHPSTMTVSMDGSNPDCPITFWDLDGKAVFSMGNDEIELFIEELQKLVC